MRSERGPVLTSLVSPATVVHHTGDEHWTVRVGATVVAYCTASEQACDLAESLNHAKDTGDRYADSRRYTPPVPVAAVRRNRAPSERISQ